MARMKVVTAENASGVRRLLYWYTRQQTGYVAGIAKIMLTDLQVAFPMLRLYNYLHLRKSSPLTRLQREMVALVVNGTIGGAP